jgi:hypothetical protein
MPGLVDVFNGVYVLCLCEGGSEEGVMNILLDENKLLFDREMLINGKVHRRMTARNVESKFLNRSYKKPVIIVRIIDSKTEQFNLGKAYKDRFYRADCLTKPEIEILVIHDADMFKEFIKVKSNTKPSEFCKIKLKHGNIKEKDFMRNYFDVDRLLVALCTYKRKSKNDHLTIYDLAK